MFYGKYFSLLSTNVKQIDGSHFVLNLNKPNLLFVRTGEDHRTEVEEKTSGNGSCWDARKRVEEDRGDSAKLKRRKGREGGREEDSQ
jgi:hypothetical protein